MAVQVSYPGVYIEEFAPGAPIQGVSTSVAAFIGLATKDHWTSRPGSQLGSISRHLRYAAGSRRLSVACCPRLLRERRTRVLCGARQQWYIQWRYRYQNRNLGNLW